MNEKKWYAYNVASPDRYLLLKEFAKKNKDYPTNAEIMLWESIRSKKLGVKFNRQHIIGDYIVDFVCLEKSLVIEVDGAYHSELEQIKYDEDRTKALKRIGFNVIRFKNEDIYSRMEWVLSEIKNKLDE